MPILIHTSGGSISAEISEFESESEVEKIVASKPELLVVPGDSRLAFVERQVDLPDAGILDLLFVSEDGLPVAVEVKLARNRESRRQIIAQIVDYLTSLTALTVDELDNEVEGALEKALRSFDNNEAIDSHFEKRWQAVGTNLRAGLARIILVLDEAPADLERIVRFLSEHSNLDIRLVNLSKYTASEVGALFVPRTVVTSEGDVSPRPTAGPQPPREALLEVVTEYDKLAVPELRTRGTASNYRQIKPPGWPPGFRVHYEFLQAKGMIGAELHLENENAGSLAEVLRQFVGKPVGPARQLLEWDQKWSKGRGRLMVRYPIEEKPEMAAKSMIDLINLTNGAVRNFTPKT